MYGMMKRHEIQVLLKAGLPQAEVARIAGVSERTVRSIQDEPTATEVEDGPSASGGGSVGPPRRSLSGGSFWIGSARSRS
jgi:hypothetical protein